VRHISPRSPTRALPCQVLIVLETTNVAALPSTSHLKPAVFRAPGLAVAIPSSHHFYLSSISGYYL